MANFRLRTPAEYGAMIWQKRNFVIIPTLIVAGALAYSIRKLPNVYESQSLIIVDPPKVSQNYVQPVSTLDVNSRLATIQKLVTSRTELQQLIERFNLYPEMRQRSVPVEEIVNAMVKDITVRQTAAPQTINSFTVTYRNSVPDKARDVTNELTARIINANSEAELGRVYATVEQIEQRVKEVRGEMEKIERERAEFYLRNPDASPDQSQALVGQLNSLAMNRQSQQSSIDMLRNQIQMNEQMLTTFESQPEVITEQSVAVGQIEGQLRTKRAELEGQLQKLKSEYTDKAPEVKAIRTQIDAINRELEDLKSTDETTRKNKSTAITKTSNAQANQLRVKIAADKRDLDLKEKDLGNINKQYTDISSRLGSVPLTAVEALKIDRDYNTLRKRYDDLLKDQDNAKFSAKLINDFSGETFRLIDPASLPETPVSPQRNLLYPLSLVLGLAVGIIAAAAAAARELMTIRDARDVAHYTKLPLMVAVPKLVTESERRLLPYIRTAKFFGALALIAVATPLLYQLIRLSGMLGILTAAN